ncbi:family 16 glycoside hydrolase [Dyadobacter sp. NIV53]|uniref:family 16 glycoside hydrolase n=1 Tax=Dyadobacter sp. NIV53 TaxID=2861765 RepID=UPI001C874CC9|nr:family 16 glycoside hydrolase [Dyadobacter sp. NIV53]
MQYLIHKISLLFLACPLMVAAQTGKGNYSPLPLKDLNSFETSGANWSVQSSISIHPAGFAKIKIQSGDGVLVGNAGNPITTKLKANDLRLSLEFMVSSGAEGNIVLPGGQKIRLSDSYQQKTANALTSGFIGQFPTQNAAKAPGLWQTIEVAYDASLPQLPNSARLNSLNLNGVTVLETVYLPTTKSVTSPEPLALEVTKGTIAFRNIGYQLLASSKPLILSNLAYKVYSDKWDSKEVYSKLDHEGKSAVLTQEVTNGMREFHLMYEGDMVVAEAGDYIFTTIYSGNIFSLDVDGKSVISNGEATSQENYSGSVNLTQGTHKFKMHYSRFPWRQPALGLRVEKAGIRPYDLHVLSSLPEPEPKPYIGVIPEMRPEMVRSFVLLDGEKNKRTHCISVGSPAGWNYTVDLGRGALLQAWRGNFANVTEMWYERGEPQLLAPAGLTAPVSGKSSLAILENINTTWPDSSNINFLGYKIDAKGFPGFRYGIGSATISDQLVSDNNGITRTFLVEGTPQGSLYSLMGSGKDIVMIEKGLYQVDNRYYIQVDKKAKVVLRPAGENKELLLPVSTTTSYMMFW